MKHAETIRAMHAQCKLDREIAEVIGLSTRRARQIRQDLNLPNVAAKRLEWRQKVARWLFLQGASPYVVAGVLDMTYSAACEWRLKMGLAVNGVGETEVAEWMIVEAQRRLGPIAPTGDARARIKSIWDSRHAKNGSERGRKAERERRKYWMRKEKNKPLPGPAAHVSARRKCLSCGEQFDSEWAGHRICDTCRPSFSNRHDCGATEAGGVNVGL